MEIEDKVKLSVYNTVTVSTLIYGCELWVLQKKHESPFDAVCEMFTKNIQNNKMG